MATMNERFAEELDYSIGGLIVELYSVSGEWTSDQLATKDEYDDAREAFELAYCKLMEAFGRKPNY